MAFRTVKDEPVSDNERNFLKHAICHFGQRADGRGRFDIRDLKISFSNEYGHVEVHLGGTKVFVATSAEVVEPNRDRPAEGFFTFNVQFSPMASLVYDPRSRSSNEIELGRVIERGLRESRAIDTEALCIISEQKVWSIRLDIRILDDVGNLTDCCSIAAITALHHFRRPDVTIGDTLILHPPSEKELVPLSIHHMPICVTFGIFEVLEEGVQILIIDPEWKEEQVMAGSMTITMNIHHEICGFQKSGGVPLPPKTILAATQVVKDKVEILTQEIQRALAQDREKRKQNKKALAK